jgi:hypothetical protein
MFRACARVSSAGRFGGSAALPKVAANMSKTEKRVIHSNDCQRISIGLFFHSLQPVISFFYTLLLATNE